MINKEKLPNKESYRVAQETQDGLYIVPLSIKHKRIYMNEGFAQKIKELWERVFVSLPSDMYAYIYKWKIYVLAIISWSYNYYVWLLAKSFYSFN